jgi:hypothetical protein
MGDEIRGEKLLRVCGKATSEGLDALARHGLDLRKKRSTPISRGSRPFAIGIAGMCSAGMTQWRAPTWTRSGTRKACGRISFAADREGASCHS